MHAADVARGGKPGLGLDQGRRWRRVLRRSSGALRRVSRHFVAKRYAQGRSRRPGAAPWRLKWQYGYYVVLGGTVAACAILYWRFRKSGWL